MATPTPADSPRRAVIYCRVSRPEQAALKPDGALGVHETSLADQETLCRRFAAQHGVVVVGVRREAFSAAELWERTALSEARQMLRDGTANMLLSLNMDRLTRGNVAHFFVVDEDAERYGGVVEFAAEPRDRGELGGVIDSIKAYKAAAERASITDRTWRGRAAKVRSGKVMATSTPKYGYQYTAARDNYEVDPTTSMVVRRIYRARLDRATLRGIAQRLQADGVPTPKGGKVWLPTVVRDILLDPAYKGEYHGWVWRKWKDPITKKVRSEKRPIEERTIIPVPALVDAETWALAQGVSAVNQRDAARNSRHPEESLLRGGFVVCGHCGGNMYVASVPKQQPAYRCARSAKVNGVCGRHGMAVGLLDDLAWQKVSALLRRPEIVAERLAHGRVEDTGVADLAAVEAAIKKTDKQITTLVDQLADLEGAAIVAAVREKLAALGERRASLAEEQRVLRRRVGAQHAVEAQVGGLVAWCRLIAVDLETLPYARKREALTALGVQATLWRADHAPRWEVTARIPLDGETGREIVFSPPRYPHPNTRAILLRWASTDVA